MKESIERFITRFQYHENGEGKTLMLVGPVLMDMLYVYELSFRIWKAVSAQQWCNARNVRIDRHFVFAAYHFVEPEELDTTTANLLAESFVLSMPKAFQGSLASLHTEIVDYMISLVDWHRQYALGYVDAAGYVVANDSVNSVKVFYCATEGCDKSYSLPNIYCPQHQAEKKVEDFPASYQEVLNMAGLDEWDAEDSSGAYCPHSNYFDLSFEGNAECGCRNPMEKIELLTIPSVVV